MMFKHELTNRETLDVIAEILEYYKWSHENCMGTVMHLVGLMAESHDVVEEALDELEDQFDYYVNGRPMFRKNVGFDYSVEDDFTRHKLSTTKWQTFDVREEIKP